MLRVKKEFEDRVSEIELYFSFLENIMVNDAKLQFPNGTQKYFSHDLNNIFLANSFLIIYNLTESCFKNAIEEIYLNVGYEGVRYDELKEGIKIEIIKFLKKNISTNGFVSNVSDLAIEIIQKCFDSQKLLSGNLDAKQVRNFAQKYGFSHSVKAIKNADGSLVNLDTNDLLIVKRNRNDLAHGIFSFKECGKGYSVQDIFKIKDHVIGYLRQILDNIEVYISNKGYLSV